VPSFSTGFYSSLSDSNSGTSVSLWTRLFKQLFGTGCSSDLLVLPRVRGPLVLAYSGSEGGSEHAQELLDSASVGAMGIGPF